jgi:hypothetical protein
MRRVLQISIVILLVFLIIPDVSAQCAMCKQAAESSLRSNPRSMARSLNSGILYLMVVPYVMIAFIFRKQLYKLIRKVGTRFFKPRAI